MRTQAFGICFLFVVGCGLISGLTTARAEPQRGGAAATSDGRYQVASAGESAVLLDSRTGDTWYLRIDERAQPPRPTWVAIKRQQDGQGRARTAATPEVQQRFVQAQLELAKLKDAFSPKHPRVVEKQREVDALGKLVGR